MCHSEREQGPREHVHKDWRELASRYSRAFLDAHGGATSPHDAPIKPFELEGTGPFCKALQLVLWVDHNGDWLGILKSFTWVIGLDPRSPCYR